MKRFVLMLLFVMLAFTCLGLAACGSESSADTHIIDAVESELDELEESSVEMLETEAGETEQEEAITSTVEQPKTESGEEDSEQGINTTYTVLYLSRCGLKLDMEELSGNTGQVVSATAKKFDGYTIAMNGEHTIYNDEDTKSIILTDDPNENHIIFTYEHEKPKQQPGEVAYHVYCNGLYAPSLIDYQKYYGEVGATITITAPEIDRYILDDFNSKETSVKLTLSEDESKNDCFFYYKPVDSWIYTNIPDDALHYDFNGSYYYNDYYLIRTSGVSCYEDAISYSHYLGAELADIENTTLNQKLYEYVFDTLKYDHAYFGYSFSYKSNRWGWSFALNDEMDNIEHFQESVTDVLSKNEGDGKIATALFDSTVDKYNWNIGFWEPDKEGKVNFLISWHDIRQEQ